jgi:hypothetical protein
MKADLETSLIHDGRNWIATGESFVATGSTLHELDNDVRRHLMEGRQFDNQNVVTVFMGFDYSTIPTWIRQYATHYFNRYIRITLHPIHDEK